MTSSQNKIRNMVMVGVFSAVSYLLMIISFSIIPSVPFLKLDISEIPVLFVMIVSGPLSGILVELIKNFLHYAIQGSLTGVPIDQFANFIAGLMFTLPLYFFYKKGLLNTLKGKLVSFSSATAILIVGMALFNYFILIPAYYYFLNMPKFTPEGLRDFIILGVVPFNIIKGIVLSLVFVFLLPKVKSFISTKR